MIRQQLVDTPAVIGDPGGQSGRPGQPLVTSDQTRQPQTLMVGAKVVDGSDHAHAPVQSLALACHGTTSANQQAQALTERPAGAARCQRWF